MFLQRYNRENKKNDVKLNSICKFEFVEYVKSTYPQIKLEAALMDFNHRKSFFKRFSLF